MKSKAMFAIAGYLFGSVFTFPQAGAQQLLPGEREAVVTGIPGVIASGVEWEIAWAGYDNADGIVGLPDGGLLFAQEQPNRVRKLEPDGSTSVYLEDTNGGGSLSIDSEGRLFAVQRTCTDPGRRTEGECLEPTKVSVLTPERKVLADRFQSGEPLGRLNDLVADSKGGAYFSVGGAYYVNRDGVVRTVADAGDIRSNGIMLSRDEGTLYVTNREVVVAFDVAPDGSVRNRRDFATLEGDSGGDGMAIDGAGRLYVTANLGVHVLGPEGQYLGLIPTPRRPITVAFSGPEKKTLYIVGSRAVAPDGRSEYTTPPGVRNNSKTIYKIPMLAEGFKGRAK